MGRIPGRTVTSSPTVCHDCPMFGAWIWLASGWLALTPQEPEAAPGSQPLVGSQPEAPAEAPPVDPVRAAQALEDAFVASQRPEVLQAGGISQPEQRAQIAGILYVVEQQA